MRRGERPEASIADDAGDVLTQAPDALNDVAPDTSPADIATAAAEHAAASQRSPASAPPLASAVELWPGLLLASAGAIGFSGKAIIAKLAYRHGVDAITLVAYRMLFALPLFALLAIWASRGREPLERRDGILIAGLGFTGYYLASTLDFMGLQYVSASLERLILYLNPTLVLAIGAIAFGRRIVPGQMVALAVSYLGVLVVFGHEITHAGPNALLGAVLVFGSAMSYALYLVYSGEEVRRIGALRLTGLASLVACALYIVQFAVLRPWSALAVAPEVIGLSVLNATLCTFAPVVLVMLAIERIGAPLVAQTGMIGPLSTLAMSVVLLGEPVTAWLLMGTALVLAGIGLLARQPRG